MTLSIPLLILALAVHDRDPVETPVESPVGEALPPASEAPPPASEPPPEPVPPPVPVSPSSLEGEVRNAADGTPFEDVMVLVDGERVAATDAQGRFQLRDLPPGRHLISLVGPQGQDQHAEVELGPGISLKRTFRLSGGQVESITLKQTSERPRREAGEVTLSQKEVAAVPGTFGDPVRVIENLPGTSRAPGGVGGELIVRGANPADSSVLMDGVQIPLLYHFGGLTSVVNSEFLSAVTFMPGGFGAQYGRATAGVAEIQSAPLACDRVRASASVDVLDAELFGCVPVGSWKVAAAARRSYIDAFLPAILEGAAEDGESPVVVSPAYFDYQLKAETTRARQRFEVFAFGSRDGLEVSRATSAEDVDLAVGGRLAFHRLQARHFYYGNRFTLESSIVPGYLMQEFNERSADLTSEHRSRADVYTVQWRETASLRLGQRVQLRGGIDHIFTHWTADFLTELPNLARRYPTPLEVDVRNHNPWHSSGTGLEQAYWSELILTPLAGVTVTPGVRASDLTYGMTHRFVVEPRLASRWQAGERTAFTAAGGIYRKLPDLFSGVMVDGFGQPNLQAERAVHLVWGLEQGLGPLETKLEGFYVRRDKLPSATDEVEVHDGKAEPVLFRSDGRGRSFGAELMLRLPAEDQRKFSGWVAYTLSRSYRRDRLSQAAGLDQYASMDPGTPRLATLTAASQEYLSPFDQTHILTAVGRRELPWNMSLGFRFQLVSGNPTTPLERGESYYDADSDQYEVRPGSVRTGSDRLPTFHRIDLRLDKRFQFDSWRLTAYLEVMNAYNRRPVEAIGYDYRYRTRTELKGLPVLPLLGVKGEL
jgi:TonB-dependent Receptor Plug Domain